MNIELTEKEYRDLLDILHIADVVLSGHRREEDKRSERHRALIQKLYALAKGGESGRLITYAEKTRRYLPTIEFEDNSIAHPLLDEFSDHLFWHELISRLSIRDAAQVVGGLEHLNAMNERDRQAVEGPVRQRYMEEFAANGVENVEVVQRFSGAGTTVRTSD
jgi:hypothetical protein